MAPVSNGKLGAAAGVDEEEWGFLLPAVAHQHRLTSIRGKSSTLDHQIEHALLRSLKVPPPSPMQLAKAACSDPKTCHEIQP